MYGLLMWVEIALETGVRGVKRGLRFSKYIQWIAGEDTVRVSFEMLQDTSMLEVHFYESSSSIEGIRVHGHVTIAS